MKLVTNLRKNGKKRLIMSMAHAGPGRGGGNNLPLLVIREAPAGTESFVIIMVDRSVPWGKTIPEFNMTMPPIGSFRDDVLAHVIIFDLPRSAQMLEGQEMPGGARFARNSFHRFGMPANCYVGPQPAPSDVKENGEHEYVFSLYALDVSATELGLTEESEYDNFMDAMAGHIIEEDKVSCFFG